MGIFFRKRTKLGKDSWLNWSKTGVSGSKRLGPVTINSRGGFSVRRADKDAVCHVSVLQIVE